MSKRLIDANELRQTIESKIYWSAIYDGLDMLEAIDDAPTVDAVEVVRCKDCIYGAKDDGRQCCNYDTLKQFVPEDFYCAFGERKNNEN